jgi:5-hmdU DNA kinase-like protein
VVRVTTRSRLFLLKLRTAKVLYDWPSAIAAFRPTVGLERKYQWMRQRHAIWEYRRRGIPRSEWDGSIDPYLREWSFCNVWRVLDGISRRTVTIARNAKSFDEQLAQVLMLKTFNEWETYEALCEILGGTPTADNLDADSLWDELHKARKAGRLQRLWRPAYTTGGMGLETIFRSAVAVVKEGGAEKLLKCNSLYEVVAALRSYPGLGPFHGTQFTLDLSYGIFLRGSLDDFCIPGIGAAKGVALAFAPRRWSGAEVAEGYPPVTRASGSLLPIGHRGASPATAGTVALSDGRAKRVF